MPDAVDLEPLLGIAFAAGDLIPDFRVEDLRSATRHGVQSGSLHRLHSLLIAHFRFFENVVVLHRREGFDMQFGPVCANALKQLGVKRHIILRQYPADDMDLRHRLIVILADDVHHLIHRVLPAFFPLLDQPGIGAEGTGIEADIGRFNVEIPVEVGLVAVFALANGIRQGTDKTQRPLLVQQQCLFVTDTGSGLHFFRNPAQRRTEAFIFEDRLQRHTLIHSIFFSRWNRPPAQITYFVGELDFTQKYNKFRNFQFRLKVQFFLFMLSILIPIYNFDVRQLVSDLEAEARALSVPYEILCFDDGSDTHFRALHQSLQDRPNIRYRALPQNLGRSRIRNLLAAEARYSYLLFMDCDSGVTSSDFLAKYLASAAANRVVVGKRMYHREPPAEPERYFRWLYGIKREQRSAEQRNRQPYEAFCTHHFLCPKAVFEQIQFDPGLRQYGHEDTQFGLDLERIGVEILHTDNPLLHIDLEPVDEFLPKTLCGIENLVYLQAKGSGIRTRLSDFYARLRKWGAAPLLAWLYPRWKALLEKNLRSTTPRLALFDLYKLSYLAYFSRRRQKDQI